MRIFGLNISRDVDSKPRKSWYLKVYEALRGVGHTVGKVARVFMPGLVDQATDTLRNKYLRDRRERENQKDAYVSEQNQKKGLFHKGGADDPNIRYKVHH
jgi:hypothetical protein